MSRKDRLIARRKNQLIIVIAFLAACLGYYILNYISPIEDVPGGSTIYILFGCVLIAVAAIVMFVTIKKQYFPKKKKSGSKPIFLDDIKNDDKYKQ